MYMVLVPATALVPVHHAYVVYHYVYTYTHSWYKTCDLVYPQIQRLDPTSDLRSPVW